MTSTATDSVRRSDRPSPTLGSCPCRAARTRSEGSVGAGRAGQAPVSASRPSSAWRTSSSSRRACRACLGAARRRSPRHGAPSPRPTGRAPIGASALTARHVGVGDLPQLGQPVNGDAQAVDLPGVAARSPDVPDISTVVSACRRPRCSPGGGRRSGRGSRAGHGTARAQRSGHLQPLGASRYGDDGGAGTVLRSAHGLRQPPDRQELCLPLHPSGPLTRLSPTPTRQARTMPRPCPQEPFTQGEY
jgi:hypothetical protein